MTCVLPRNCKKTLQSLPYETSSRPDSRVVPLLSLRYIVTQLFSSNKLQHMHIQRTGVMLFLR